MIEEAFSMIDEVFSLIEEAFSMIDEAFSLIEEMLWLLNELLLSTSLLVRPSASLFHIVVLSRVSDQCRVRPKAGCRSLEYSSVKAEISDVAEPTPSSTDIDSL